jgi:hypothetical protein
MIMNKISIVLSEDELNELIYAIGLNYRNQLADREVSAALEERLRDALDELNKTDSSND